MKIWRWVRRDGVHYLIDENGVIKAEINARGGIVEWQGKRYLDFDYVKPIIECFFGVKT